MVEVEDIREFEEYSSGVIKGKRVVLEDFAFGLGLMLEGVEHKIHAGCLFHVAQDGIRVQLGDSTTTITRKEARAFVRKYRSE